MTRDALKALREAVAEVIEKARRDGRKIAIWRDGKAVHISPDDLDKEKDDEKRASKRDTVSPEFKRYQKMMKPKPQQPKSPLARKALMALREAVAEVFEKAKREGRPLAVWQDGKAVLVYPGNTDAVEEPGSKYQTRTTSKKRGKK